jgi:hypothetical protein
VLTVAVVAVLLLRKADRRKHSLLTELSATSANDHLSRGRLSN